MPEKPHPGRFLAGAAGSAAQDIFAKEISKIPDDNLQLLAGMLVSGAAGKLLGGDARAGAEAAFYAIITQDGRKGTIRIQEVIREIGTGKF